MATLPQLLEEDIQALDLILGEFLRRSDATTAFVVDKGGFLIAQRGEADAFDLTTIGALAAGAYSANHSIARLLHEEHFACVYQQGGKFSMLAINVDEASLLLVIFRAQVGVGAVKFYAGRIRERIARQLRRAHERDPDAELDLSKINVAETRAVFQRKA